MIIQFDRQRQFEGIVHKPSFLSWSYRVMKDDKSIKVIDLYHALTEKCGGLTKKCSLFLDQPNVVSDANGRKCTYALNNFYSFLTTLHRIDTKNMCKIGRVLLKYKLIRFMGWSLFIRDAFLMWVTLFNLLPL